MTHRNACMFACTLVVSTLLTATHIPTYAAGLPEDFVYLRTIDPTILQDMRYATTNNFTGAIVPGYEAGECILRGPAAVALKRVQHALKSRNFSLKVYDCYRPARGVRAFGFWAVEPDAPNANRYYYPILGKDKLYGKGYISSRSNHSRGIAVDLTLVRLPVRAPTTPQTLSSCIAPKPQRIPDNSLDMGTGYDCFDTRSHTKDNRIPKRAIANRRLLKSLMEQNGFKNYRREWWHFTYRAKSYPKVYFDFTVAPLR